MEGAVAITVFDFAAEKIPDDDVDKAAFLASMLDVALDFEFARGKDDAVRKHIEKWVTLCFIRDTEKLRVEPD